IIADVEDAFRWLRGAGAKECHLDADRVVVTGGSAGGYLTLMTGVTVRPRPRALVAYWGYGDVDGAWYTTPSEFYRKQGPLIDKPEAYKGVGGRVITGSEEGVDFRPRGRFYLYLRQNGLWTKEVTGFDPAADRAKLDRYCPVRNVSPQYPPTRVGPGARTPRSRRTRTPKRTQGRRPATTSRPNGPPPRGRPPASPAATGNPSPTPTPRRWSSSARR